MPRIAKAEIDMTIKEVKEIVDRINARNRREKIAELDRIIHPVAQAIRTESLIDNPKFYKYGLPYPREFHCRYCHAYVYISANEIDDHRSVFCCARCEREYWRKVTKHPTHLTNYGHGKYQAIERRENKRDGVEALENDIKVYEALKSSDDDLPEVANKALKEYQNER